MTEHSHHNLAGRIMRGLFVLVVFGIGWKFGGLLMNILMGSFYGAGPTLDAWTEVFSVLVFTFLYSSMLKVVIPAFMPLFAEEREHGGEEAAWRLASTVLNLVLLAGAGIVVGTMLFSPQIIQTLVPGFDPQAQSTAAVMLRWMMPGVFVMFFAVMALGILNSYKVFSYPAAADAVQKLTWAAVLFLLVRGLHMSTLAEPEKPIYLGFLVGAFVQFCVLLFGLRGKVKQYRPKFAGLSPGRILKELAFLAGAVALFAGMLAFLLSNFAPEAMRAHARFLAIVGGTVIGFLYAGFLWLRARRRTGMMARFATLAAPLLIGVIFARFRDLSTAFFQSYTLTGVFGSMELAKKIGNLPVILLAYSLSIAMFPYLCDLAVRKDLKTFSRLLTGTVHSIALLAVPMTVGIIVLNRPLMEVVFDRGNWSEEMLAYGGAALAFFSSALVFYALENVIMQSSFSLKHMWTPTILGIIATVTHSAFLFIAIRTLGYDAPIEIFVIVAASFPLSRALKNLVLMVLLKRHIDYLPFRRTAVFVVKLILVAAGVGAAAWFTLRPTQRMLPYAHLREREVMIDTFNPEPRGWFSHEISDLRVEHPDGLMRATFDLRKGRVPRLYRDLSDLDLAGVSELHLNLDAVFDDRGWKQYPNGEVPLPSLAVVLVDAQGNESHYALDIGLSSFDYRIALAAPKGDAKPNADIASLRRLIFQVRQKRKSRYSVRLAVQSLSFVRGEDVIVVDDFQNPVARWSDVAGEVTNVSEDEGTSEMMLRLRTGAGVAARLGLSGYRLGGCTEFQFKAKAAKPATLRLRLDKADKSSVIQEVAIEESENRKGYVVPMESSLEDVVGARFEVVGDAPVLLDNIAFVRPVQRIPYELRKMIVLGVPASAGTLAFLVLCLLLRVREALDVVGWVKRRGWREREKVKAEAKAADGEDDAPGGPEASE